MKVPCGTTVFGERATAIHSVGALSGSARRGSSGDVRLERQKQALLVRPSTLVKSV